MPTMLGMPNNTPHRLASNINLCTLFCLAYGGGIGGSWSSGPTKCSGTTVYPKRKFFYKQIPRCAAHRKDAARLRERVATPASHACSVAPYHITMRKRAQPMASTSNSSSPRTGLPTWRETRDHYIHILIFVLVAYALVWYYTDRVPAPKSAFSTPITEFSEERARRFLTPLLQQIGYRIFLQ